MSHTPEPDSSQAAYAGPDRRAVRRGPLWPQLCRACDGEHDPAKHEARERAICGHAEHASSGVVMGRWFPAYRPTMGVWEICYAPRERGL